MSDTVEIQSNGVELALFNLVPRDKESWYSFDARITDAGLHAQARVVNWHGPTIADYFKGLEQSWRGWEGKKEWEAMEGHLQIASTIDRLGHITSVIKMRNDPGPGGWKAECELIKESGAQLSGFVRELREFFRSAGV